MGHAATRCSWRAWGGGTTGGARAHLVHAVTLRSASASRVSTIWGDGSLCERVGRFRFAGASPLNPMIKQQIPTCPVDVPGSLGLQAGCLASGECPHWRPHVPTTSTTHQTGIQESSPARPSMRPPAIRQALRGRHTLFVSVPRSLTKGSSRYDSRCPSTCVAPAATIRSARASGSTPRRRQLASTSLQR